MSDRPLGGEEMGTPGMQSDSELKKSSSAVGAINHRHPARIARNFTREPLRDGQPASIHRVTVLGFTLEFFRAPGIRRHTCDTVSSSVSSCDESGRSVELVGMLALKAVPPSRRRVRL